MGVLETPSVRGTFVLNTFDFIREHYSPAAHTMVLQMLPVPRPSLSEARETSWTPLEDLVAYMETAKAVLAPGDPTFYRKMGFYGGSHMRALWVGIAVSFRRGPARGDRGLPGGRDSAHSRFSVGRALLPALSRLRGGRPQSVGNTSASRGASLHLPWRRVLRDIRHA